MPKNAEEFTLLRKMRRDKSIEQMGALSITSNNSACNKEIEICVGVVKSCAWEIDTLWERKKPTYSLASKTNINTNIVIFVTHNQFSYV